MNVFYLWRALGEHPREDAPVGLVKTGYAPYGAFFTPQRPAEVMVFALDAVAEGALAEFDGGDLVFGSVRDGIGYRMDNVRSVSRVAKGKFKVIVIDGRPLRPLPDAFEWPRPAPPAPAPLSEEEREEAALEALLRLTEDLRRRDPGLAPLVAESRGAGQPRRSSKRRRTRRAA